MITEIIVPRKVGRGGAYMRIRVCRSRRCVRSVVRRMAADRWPKHRIAKTLAIPRLAVDRILRREVWRG